MFFFFFRELCKNFSGYCDSSRVIPPRSRECNLRWSKGLLRENRVLLRRRDDTRWRNEPRRAVAPSIIPARVGYPPSLIPASATTLEKIYPPVVRHEEEEGLRLLLYPFLSSSLNENVYLIYTPFISRCSFRALVVKVTAIPTRNSEKNWRNTHVVRRENLKF